MAVQADEVVEIAAEFEARDVFRGNVQVLEIDGRRRDEARQHAALHVAGEHQLALDAQVVFLHFQEARLLHGDRRLCRDGPEHALIGFFEDAGRPGIETHHADGASLKRKARVDGGAELFDGESFGVEHARVFRKVFADDQFASDCEPIEEPILAQRARVVQPFLAEPFACDALEIRFVRSFDVGDLLGFFGNEHHAPAVEVEDIEREFKRDLQHAINAGGARQHRAELVERARFAHAVTQIKLALAEFRSRRAQERYHPSERLLRLFVRLIRRERGDCECADPSPFNDQRDTRGSLGEGGRLALLDEPAPLAHADGAAFGVEQLNPDSCEPGEFVAQPHQRAVGEEIGDRQTRARRCLGAVGVSPTRSPDGGGWPGTDTLEEDIRRMIGREPIRAAVCGGRFCFNSL